MNLLIRCKIERPARSRAHVVGVSIERVVERAKSFAEIWLRLEERLSPVYERGEPSAPEAEEVSSRKKKLSSSTISIEKRSKTTGHCRRLEEYGVRGIQTEELGTDNTKEMKM